MPTVADQLSSYRDGPGRNVGGACATGADQLSSYRDGPGRNVGAACATGADQLSSYRDGPGRNVGAACATVADQLSSYRDGPGRNVGGVGCSHFLGNLCPSRCVRLSEASRDASLGTSASCFSWPEDASQGDIQRAASAAWRLFLFTTIHTCLRSPSAPVGGPCDRSPYSGVFSCESPAPLYC